MKIGISVRNHFHFPNIEIDFLPGSRTGATQYLRTFPPLHNSLPKPNSTTNRRTPVERLSCMIERAFVSERVCSACVCVCVCVCGKW
jgi:hypothetical protein